MSSRIQLDHPDLPSPKAMVQGRESVGRDSDVDPPMIAEKALAACLQMEAKPDLEKEAQYWEAYRLQQARRACPGCGEDGALY